MITMTILYRKIKKKQKLLNFDVSFLKSISIFDGFSEISIIFVT